MLLAYASFDFEQVPSPYLVGLIVIVSVFLIYSKMEEDAAS